MTTSDFRAQFLLEPGITFLNHGSFGACPRPVFEEYQRLQLELEQQPVRFLGREFRDRMAQARADLAAYLGADADDLVYVPNATTGLNIVAKSLNLQAGDEVLTTDHEYGALDRTWTFVCRKAGARIVRAPVRVPIESVEEVVEGIWSHVTDRTRVLFLSHITSPTALILPIEPLIARARDAGILSIIDGAHAPGQIPLDLTALGADVYAGNCHKWMLAPKGAAFLHVRQAVQSRIEPLVVSWGWESEHPGPSRFVDHHEWTGTRDISAFLTVPAAIRFMADNDWWTVAARCRQMLFEHHANLLAVTGGTGLSPATPTWLAQMAAFEIATDDPQAFQKRLHDEHHVEVPIVRWNERSLLRVSVNAYNRPDDLDTVARAFASTRSF